jgi:opacity protein-like surface antigen
MKKILLLSIITAASLMAGDYASLQEIEASQQYHENVQEKLNNNTYDTYTEGPYIFLKGSYYDVDFDNSAYSDSTAGLAIGFGADSIHDNGMLVGARGFLGFGEISDINMVDVGIEGKFGYSWNQSFNSYLLLGWKYTNIDGNGFDSVAAYGFGGGLGTEFMLNNHFGVAVEYTYYSMDPDSSYGIQPADLGNYDNQNVGLQVNYHF